MNRYGLLCLALLVAPLAAAPAADEDLTPQLPPDLYAVVGQPLAIWYDNLVLTRTPEAYTFTVTSEVGGTAGERAWTLTPTAAQVGDHALTVNVRDAAADYGTATTTLHVAPADAGAGRPFTLLIVGDSLTNANQYPTELGRLMSEPGGPQWRMLGTNRRPAESPVGHEGYGGWTWQRFATRYEPEPDPATRKISSPFIFLINDQPTLDVGRYLDEHYAGARPDVVTFLLGINDCFGAPPTDPAGQDARFAQVFDWAEKLLAAFRQACPQAIFGIGLTTPPNSRQAAFEANYQDKYTRWGWKSIQHRLVQAQIRQFGGRSVEGIELVPTEIDCDPVDGYPENNSVHPNKDGYNQIARSFHAWLKNLWARG